MHKRIGIGELADALTAAPAGCAEVCAIGNNKDFTDLSCAARHHSADGAGLGALALRIGGVFGIRAAEDPIVLSKDGRADFEMGVGRISVKLRGLRLIEETVEREGQVGSLAVTSS